jgi:ABC-type Na+ efflux pump permease subunit
MAQAARTATANEDDQRAVAADHPMAATGEADAIAESPSALDVPATSKNERPDTAEVGGAAAVGSAAGLLALAQKLHQEYVAEGKDTRERLITEGQSRHDTVVAEATAKHEELLSASQAKYDELVSIGEARHEALMADADVLIAEATAEHERMITEARERSSGMVVQARQERAEVLHGLGGERSVLQKAIEELRTVERHQHARQKSYLEGRLTELERTGADEAGY